MEISFRKPTMFRLLKKGWKRYRHDIEKIKMLETISRCLKMNRKS